MKFDKYFILFLFAGLLFSCSDDKIDDTPIGTPAEVYDYDASLSLAVGNIEVKTKAEINGPNDLSLLNNPDRVQKLSLAVFSKNNKLMAFKKVTCDNGTAEEVVKDPEIDKNYVYRVMDLKVVSGTVKILLIANYDEIPESWYQVEPSPTDEFGIGKTTVDHFLNNLESTLDSEINGNLTMSSGLLTFNLHAGHNFIGCAQQLGEVSVDGKKGTELLGQEKDGKSLVSKIKLYHNIARVQIGLISLDPKPEFGDTAKGGYAEFYLDEIFVANVKSKSMVCSEEPWGTVEYPTPGEATDFWWCGGYVNEEGNLKKGKAKDISYLKYDFKKYEDLPKEESYKLYNDYPFVSNYKSAILGKIDKRSAMKMRKPHTEGYAATLMHDPAGYYPIGMFFYVYENNQLDENSPNQTLMILKGDYRYKKNNEESEVKTITCYYAVPINNAGSYIQGDDSAVIDHKYIKRNYHYILELNIKGPGSSKPYDKEISANIGVSIKVEDWNVKHIDESVE